MGLQNMSKQMVLGNGSKSLLSTALGKVSKFNLDEKVRFLALRYSVTLTVNSSSADSH